MDDQRTANGLGDDSVPLLIDIMERCLELESFNVHFNHITTSQQLAFASVVAVHSALKFLLLVRGLIHQESNTCLDVLCAVLMLCFSVYKGWPNNEYTHFFELGKENRPSTFKICFKN